MVASRSARANSTDTELVIDAIGANARAASGVERDALGAGRPVRLRREFLARASLTVSSSLEPGTTSSTSRQSTARLPLMPSSVVQNTSAWSRRTLRLSVTRVSPPVPGSTASSGSSGSDTVEEPSSISMMWSAASASS